MSLTDHTAQGYFKSCLPADSKSGACHIRIFWSLAICPNTIDWCAILELVCIQQFCVQLCEILTWNWWVISWLKCFKEPLQQPNSLISEFDLNNKVTLKNPLTKSRGLEVGISWWFNIQNLCIVVLPIVHFESVHFGHKTLWIFCQFVIPKFCFWSNHTVGRQVLWVW